MSLYERCARRVVGIPKAEEIAFELLAGRRWCYLHEWWDAEAGQCPACLAAETWIPDGPLWKGPTK